MRKLGRALVLGLCGAVLAGCVVHPHLRSAKQRHPASSQVRVHKAGPPAHAPAHGYRQKQHGGVEMAFDSGIGVYVVVGHANHYFHNGYYFRLVNGAWQISATLERGWAAVASEKIPKGLLKKHGKKKPRRVPAKHRH